jgi:hypothetical protein
MNMLFHTIIPNRDIGRMPAIYVQKIKPTSYNRSARDNKCAKHCLFHYEHMEHKLPLLIDDTYVISLFYREY